MVIYFQIAELNSEIEGISQEREYIKSHILELQTKLEQQANVHREQVMEFQKTIQNCLDEKDELRSQITVSSFTLVFLL